MYNPYAESLFSTGEPPTVPESSRNSPSSRQTLCSGNISIAQTSHEEMSSSLSTGTRSRTVSAQESDSGYEPSPTSIVNDSQRFFGEQTVSDSNAIDQCQACSPPFSSLSTDEEFDIVECHSQILFSESESDLEDYDTCQDCCSSSFICSCSRTDSSNTNATVISNCDNSRCNSSDLSVHRPSSQPIQIPNLPVCRISREVCDRLERSFSSLLEMYPHGRSLPLDFYQLQRLGLFPENRPVSWPSAHSPLRLRRNVALPSPRNYHISESRDIPNRSRRFNHPTSRRQIIDSEASSFCSSDDEVSEDVFNYMSGREASSLPMSSFGGGPLPDVVLQSTDSRGRSRSASVSLPLTAERRQVIRDVAQRLRRMSDLFAQGREFRMALLRAQRDVNDYDEPPPNGIS